MIRVIAAPYFLATKFVAFVDRGESDHYASHDLEDILAVVDGRPSLVDEIAAADESVRSFLMGSVEKLLANSDFQNALPGHVERGREAAVRRAVTSPLPPSGNPYELNCYDHQRIKAELIEADGVEPVRYWPPELYATYRKP